jgi:hypothetical protein
VFYRMRRELDCLGDRAATGARHHARRIDAARDQRIEQRDALVCRHRVRLAGRAERGKPAVLRQQPSAMPDEPFPVRRKIGPERRYDRREHAADAFTRGKRVNCRIIRHFLIVPSSFQLFEHQWAENALFHHSASTCRFFCNRSAELGSQIWAAENVLPTVFFDQVYDSR